MPKYKVKNTNLLHNGDLKKIGDVIELTEAQAKKLGSVVVEVKEKTQNPPATKTETQANKTSKGTKTKKEETTPAEDKKDGTDDKGENN